MGLNAQTLDPTALDRALEKTQKAYTEHQDSFLSYWNHTDALLKQNPDYKVQLELYRLLGAWQFLSGKHLESINTLNKGIAYGEKNKACHELVILHYELGTVYSKNKNLKLAYDFIQKGISLAQSLKDTSALADGNNRLGILYENKGALDTAYQYYNKSLVLNLLAKDTLGLSYSYENLATVMAQQNKTDQAIAYLQKALFIRKNKNDQYGIAIATINISEAYYTQKKLDSAISYAHKAIEAGKQTNFLDLLQHSYKQLSSMYKEQGAFQKALDYHEKFSTLHDSIFNERKAQQISELGIQFDTERKEQQIKVLSKQKTIRNLGLLAATLILLVLSAALYLIYKNKKSKEEKLQAEAAYKLQLKEIEAQAAMKNERLRISRELHDNIGAHLTFINATVESLEDKNEKTQQIQELTHETIRELRKTVWLINKEKLTAEEFSLKLRDIFNKVPNLEIQTQIEQPQLVLKAELVSYLFRAAQEAINNALKHAQATQLLLHLKVDLNDIELWIKDNGIGFEIHDNESMGYGLDNMKYRMEALNGRMILNTAKAKGTEILLHVPIQKD